MCLLEDEVESSFSFNQTKLKVYYFYIYNSFENIFNYLFLYWQIKSEAFLEDINNILNSGDVPNIYGMDEMEQIQNAMKPVIPLIIGVTLEQCLLEQCVHV